MRVLRELTRRRLRTALAILGITIGIWALVVFSSMAKKINSFVDSGADLYVGKIIVSDASSRADGVRIHRRDPRHGADLISDRQLDRDDTDSDTTGRGLMSALARLSEETS